MFINYNVSNFINKYLKSGYKFIKQLRNLNAFYNTDTQTQYLAHKLIYS